MKIKTGSCINEQRSKQKSSRQERKINGFPFPSEIIELGIKRNLSTKEAYFLMILLNAMNEKNKTCWKSEKTLATEVRCGRATIERIRNSLEEKGIIEVGKKKKWRGRFALNEYKIVYPWPSPCLKASQAPSIRVSQGALTHFSKPPSINVSQKSVKRELVKKVNESRKNRTDDDSFLTSRTEEMSRGKDRPLSLYPTASDRESFARAGHPGDGEFDFGDFVWLYKQRKDLDAPMAPHIEDQIRSFYQQMTSAHWNRRLAPPGAGMKRLFFRACRAGAGEPFGLVIKSLEQIEQDRKEEERLRIEKEKEQAKEKRYYEFIHHPIVCAMLKKADLDPDGIYLDGGACIKEYLNSIRKTSGARNKSELLKACEKELIHQRKIRKSDERMMAEIAA